MIKWRRIRLARHATRMEENTRAQKASIRNPGGRRALEIPRNRRMNNIKMEL
jgi:hypothetical protein